MQSSAAHSGQSRMQPLSFGSARFATFGFASFLIHIVGGHKGLCNRQVRFAQEPASAEPIQAISA